MIEFRASLDVTPALVRFETLGSRFKDFIPVLGGRVDVAARRLIRRQFQTEGRAGGRGGWEKLKDDTIKRRGSAHPILRDTSTLMEVLTQRGHEGQEVVLEPDQYSITVDESYVDGDGKVVYARFIAHQEGKGNNPVRQVIPDPLPKTFIKEVSAIVRSYVMTGKK